MIIQIYSNYPYISRVRPGWTRLDLGKVRHERRGFLRLDLACQKKTSVTRGFLRLDLHPPYGGTFRGPPDHGHPPTGRIRATANIYNYRN